MYAIEDGLKKVNDVEVETFRREIVDGYTCIEVEAGTTGYKGGGCRKSGGRTYVSIYCVFPGISASSPLRMMKAGRSAS